MSESRKEDIADGITLWFGDCLSVIPIIGAVDHVISDPPYEDEMHAAFGRKIDRNDGRNLQRNVNMLRPLEFSGINATRSEVATAIVGMSTGWAILFCLAEGVRAWRDAIQAASGKWDTTLFWIKPDASPRFNGQGAARGAECAVTAWCGTGYRKWNGGGKRGVYTHCVNTNRQGEHPTEKPLSLMSDLVVDFTQPNQLVCDPFCGSGSTGIACINHGRRFVGIERDPKWFDLSCRRLSDALKRPRLPFVEPRKIVQEEMPL